MTIAGKRYNVCRVPKKVTTNNRPSKAFPGKKPPYTSRRHLLTPGERRFYRFGLEPAVRGRWLIAFKPRLADLITTENFNSKQGRQIAMKHVDFALLTPRTTRIVAAIELNDATHKQNDRQIRDAFVADALRVAGIPLIGFPIYREYDPKIIRWHIQKTLEGFKPSVC